MGHVNAINYNIWRMQTARASYASVFVVCRIRCWHNQHRRQSIFPNKRRYGQSVVYVWTKTLKIIKLSEWHPAKIKLGLTVGVWTESTAVYHDLIKLATKIHGPPTSIKTIIKGKRPIATWNHHATLHLLNFKDEATFAWLMLIYENN